MTANNALLWFGIGTPVCCAMFIVTDRLFTRDRGRFVPRAVTAATPSPAAATTPVPRTEPARPARPVRTFVANVRPPRPVREPWAPGDGLRHLIAGGGEPSAATLRKRAWTSYAMIACREVYGAANIVRLERGRPPLRFNPLLGAIEAMQVEIDDVGRARLHWPAVETAVDPCAAAPVR